MADLGDLLRQILQEPERWREHMASSSVSELKKVNEQLIRAVTDYERILEELEQALNIVQTQIEKREATTEKRRRATRRGKVRCSLREFLSQPLLEMDMPLNTLALCTKTGASLLLKALVFKLGGIEQKALTSNEAKRYYQHDHAPWAGYNLHYVRDGQESAGFGWDRPFLDEIFVQ